MWRGWRVSTGRSDRRTLPARLQIQQRLQGRTPARLASPYVAYRLPLSGFRPQGSALAGMLVAARINGSRPVRLLLDTGARGIVIDSGTARKLDLETVAASRLGGFGDAGKGESRVALARSVTFGDLAFEDCLVEVAGQSLTAGADGMIGADVFERFRIGVDGRAGVLQLAPFDDSPRAGSQASVPAVGIGKLLLVKVRVQGGSEGLFLVDTGAAFTTVSRQHVPIVPEARHAVAMQGAQGACERISHRTACVRCRRRPDPDRFRTAGDGLAAASARRRVSRSPESWAFRR